MPLLSVKNLRTHFLTPKGVLRAVDGVSFSLEEGQVLGIVGESGSGKSVTALSLMRLMPENGATSSADELVFDGTNLLDLTKAQLRAMRSRRMAMVFQDPMRSPNPVLTVGRQLTETLVLHMKMNKAAARKRAIELLERVGISRAEKRLDEYPHQFSGGMRQRVMIAIALSCNPRLLIADEATTALDVTIQAQIVDLVKGIQRDFGMAVIWISHDLGLVAGLCDQVAVMYAGRVVESGPVREVFYRPAHGYTVGLMQCTPRIDDIGNALRPIEGMPPNLAEPIERCPFLPRCQMAVKTCHDVMPTNESVGPSHVAACFGDLKPYWRGGAST
jgi:oligopeptide/dipeptide ABC transporter ATP-binding protein